MPENLPKTLNCPACGAPLDFDGTSTVVRCKFCRNISLVPSLLSTQTETPQQTLDEIRRLAERGKIIEAIQRYRLNYRVDLADAKEAVDALLAGRLVEPSEAAETAQRAEDFASVLADIKTILDSGNKIEAIRKYREIYDTSLTQAKYAIEQMEAGLTFDPGMKAPIRPAVQPVILTEPITTTIAKNKTNWIGCSITLVILGFFGAILAFALAQPGGPFIPMLLAGDPAILLEAETQPDVAAVFYNPDQETHLIGRVSTADGKLSWTSEPLAGSGYVDALVSSGDLLYLASETILMALKASDGSLAWQVEMPDKLNYGGNSLIVKSGRVIALTLDESLQAYDAQTGQMAWSRRMSGYDRQLRVMGNRLVIVDYLDDSYTYSLVFLDPVDGSQQRVMTPVCQKDEYSSETLDPDSGIIYDEAENALYLVFGSYPGCVQRFDLSNGGMTWQALDEEGFSYASDGYNGILTPAMIYFGDSNQLMGVNKSNGSLQVLLNNEDYEFMPLAVSGERLIVRARRTRGTERFELWGLEADSGERLWQMTLDNSKPLDPPDELSGLVDDSESGWTWQLTSDGGFLLLKFQASPNQLGLDSLSPLDGSLVSKKTVALKKISGDFYGVPVLIGWVKEQVYFVVESHIYGVETTTGEIIFEH